MLSEFRKYAGLLMIALAVTLFVNVNAGEVAATDGLTVTGEVEKTLKLSAADLTGMAHRTIKTEEKGKQITYEGVSVTEILKKAGLSLGEKQMRHEKLMLYVLAEASDGYVAMFALSEFDPDLSDKIYLIADRKDGQPLSAAEGPFRLVIPSEGMHSRWVKQITTLRIGRVPGKTADIKKVQ